MSYKLKVRPTTIVAIRNRNDNSTIFQWRKKPTRKEHDGKLSDNARRKVKSAIRWLIACSTHKQCYEKQFKRMVDYKVNFVTLTFKENFQDDNKARYLLSKWLEMAKYRFNLERYVWKAEPQKRGAIHFHLVTGLYLPHKEVCYTWNRLLFSEGLDQRNANSTDVHAVVGVNNLEAYVTDYVMNEDKHKGRRPIKGRLWGCDQKLSRAGKLYEHVDDQDAQAIREELSMYSLQNKMNNPPKFLDYIDVYCLPESFYQEIKDTSLGKLYAQELALLKPVSRQKEFFPRTLSSALPTSKL